MADVTVIKQTPLNGTTRWKFVMHFEIPVGDNDADVSWRLALVRSRIGGTTILELGDGEGGTISAADMTLIKEGALLEHVVEIELENGSQASLEAAVTALFDDVKAARIADLQTKLQWTGKTLP